MDMNTNYSPAILSADAAQRVYAEVAQYRDLEETASLWTALTPDLLGQPVADIVAEIDLRASGVDTDALLWQGLARAIRSVLAAPIDAGGDIFGDEQPGDRSLHELVEAVGDVTALVTAARAVAGPVASAIQRALDRRRERRQDATTTASLIETDLPGAAGLVALR